MARLATSGHTCFTPPRLEHRPVRSPRKPRTTSKASLARASPTSPSVPPLHVSRGTNIACRGRLAMRDGHGRRIGVSRAGLASVHATTLLQLAERLLRFVRVGAGGQGAHPGRRSPSDRLGKWSGAHTRSAIPRCLRDGAVEQGLTRPCCCIYRKLKLRRRQAKVPRAAPQVSYGSFEAAQKPWPAGRSSSSERLSVATF